MRAEDVFKDKPFLDKFDIMNIYQCNVTKAYSIIRAIHYVSNVLNANNKVAEQDYFAWNGYAKKGENKNDNKTNN